MCAPPEKQRLLIPKLDPADYPEPWPDIIRKAQLQVELLGAVTFDSLRSQFVGDPDRVEEIDCLETLADASEDVPGTQSQSKVSRSNSRNGSGLEDHGTLGRLLRGGWREDLEAALQSDPPDLDQVGAVLRDMRPELDRLDRLDFQVVREQLLLMLSGKVKAPGKLLDAAFEPPNKKAQPEATVALQDPEPWPEEVDGADLLEQLRDTFLDHLIISPQEADAMGLWIVHTHCVGAAHHTPRLAVLSPEPRCGKSLALDLIEKLAFKAIKADNISEAATFRVISQYRPTLLLDEVDSFLDRAEGVRNIVNAGHKRGAVAIRCAGDEHEVKIFDVFAPVALAAIRDLPDTILDRSVVIRMKRKTREQKVKRLVGPEGRFRDLQRQCVRWAQDHQEDLSGRFPDFPEALNDRQVDSWSPLFAIAEVAGECWLEMAHKAAVRLGAYQEDEDSIGVQLLGDVREILRAEFPGYKFVGTKVLLKHLTEDAEKPWATYARGDKPMSPHSLAKLLKPYGINSRQDPTKSFRGYVVAELEDAFPRYVPPLPQDEAS